MIDFGYSFTLVSLQYLIYLHFNKDEIYYCKDINRKRNTRGMFSSAKFILKSTSKLSPNRKYFSWKAAAIVTGASIATIYMWHQEKNCLFMAVYHGVNGQKHSVMTHAYVTDQSLDLKYVWDETTQCILESKDLTAEEKNTAMSELTIKKHIELSLKKQDPSFAYPNPQSNLKKSFIEVPNVKFPR